MFRFEKLIPIASYYLISYVLEDIRRKVDAHPAVARRWSGVRFGDAVLGYADIVYGLCELKVIV